MTTDEALALLKLEPETTYSVQEVATRLGLRSRRSVYVACQNGKLETTRDGWGYRIAGRVVAAWVAERVNKFIPQQRSAETR